VPLRIAIVNDHRWIAPVGHDDYTRNILEEDALLIDALQRLGASCVRVDWASSAIDWSGFDAAVIRQTWDYFERYAEFRSWLDRIEPLTRVINPVSVLRWNGDKRYLAELAERGVATVPTRVVARQPNPPSLAESLSREGWTEAVIKPAVSGAGRETWRVKRSSDFEQRWQRLVREEDMLIQPFMPEIVESGEVSLMVIAGRVTHAVLKRAAPGEFRVQDDHGGTVHPHEPLPGEIRMAEQAIAAVPGNVTYARVDLVDSLEGPRLMELELIEPELFFRNQPIAADRFAAAVFERVG